MTEEYVNAKRRRRIRKIVSRLEDCKDDLTDIRYEEDEALRNTPENLSGRALSQHSEDASSSIDDAISDIDDAISSLEEV